MEDNLNQSIGNEEEVLIDFSEDTEEETETETETEAEVDNAEPTEEQDEEPTEDDSDETPTDEEVEEWLDVKYNGEVQKLTKQQAVEFAQKGMNYDKVQQRYNDLVNSPILQICQQQADGLGITLDEYAERLESFQQAQTRNEFIESYKEKFPEASDEMAEDYADLALQAQYEKMHQAQQEKEMQEQYAQQEAIQRQLDDFLRAYPDIDTDTIPDEVFDACNDGETLLSAYRAYENKLLREKLEAERKNQTNKQKAVGKLNENSSTPNGKDPFLAGLLG